MSEQWKCPNCQSSDPFVVLHVLGLAEYEDCWNSFHEGEGASSVVNCWEDGPRRGENWTTGSIGTGSTCMLPDGHDGSHEFTWDDEIEVAFDG